MTDWSQIEHVMRRSQQEQHPTSEEMEMLQKALKADRDRYKELHRAVAHDMSPNPLKGDFIAAAAEGDPGEQGEVYGEAPQDYYDRCHRKKGES